MRVDLQLQPGVYYYLIVKYYKPNHYINYDDSFTGALTLVHSILLENLSSPFKITLHNLTRFLDLFNSHGDLYPVFN